MDVIYYSKKDTYKAKSTRKEGHGLKSGGDQAQASKSLLPVRSWMYLIPPETN